jgi:DnaJ-domain-containing protein 1
VIRTILYRPDFFGKHFSALTQTVMRESRHWSAGECELFAAFVSRKNQCHF